MRILLRFILPIFIFLIVSTKSESKQLNQNIKPLKYLSKSLLMDEVETHIQLQNLLKDVINLISETAGREELNNLIKSNKNLQDKIRWLESGNVGGLDNLISRLNHLEDEEKVFNVEKYCAGELGIPLHLLINKEGKFNYRDFLDTTLNISTCYSLVQQMRESSKRKYIPPLATCFITLGISFITENVSESESMVNKYSLLKHRFLELSLLNNFYEKFPNLRTKVFFENVKENNFNSVAFYDHRMAWCLKSYAWNLLYLDKDKEAFKYFLKAEEMGNVDASFFLGHMYYEGFGVEKDDEKAQEYYLKAGKKNHYRAAQEYADILESRGEYTESLKIFEYLLSSPDVTKSEKKDFTWNAAKASYHAGNYSYAYELWHQIYLEEYKNKNISPDMYEIEISLLGNLTLTLWDMRNYEKAMEYSLEREKLYYKYKINSKDTLSGIYNQRGIILGDTGHKDTALKFYKKALQLMREIEKEGKEETDYERFGWVLNNIGRHYNLTEDYKLSEKYHKEALSIRIIHRGEFHPDTANSYSNLGDTYTSIGKFDEAEKLLLKALQIRKDSMLENAPRLGFNYYALGRLYEKKGEYKKSEENYKIALSIYKSSLEPHADDIAFAESDLANLFFIQDKYSEALTYAENASKIFKGRSGLNRVVSGNFVSQEMSEWVKHYELHANILQNLKNHKQAFKYLQWANNSRAADALLSNYIRKQIETQANDNLVRIYQDKFKEFEEIENLLKAESLKKDKEKDHKIIKRYISKINLLKKEIFKMEIKMAKKAPNYGKLIAQEPINVEEIRKKLNKDEAFLFYYTLKNHTYVSVITSTDFSIVKIDKTNLEIKEKIDSIRKSLDPLKEFNILESKKLYDNIFRPIVPLIENKNKITVVANKDISKIPFSLLVSDLPEQEPNYKTVNWLAKNYIFSYLPSVSSFKFLKNKKISNVSYTKKLVGFGNPVIKQTFESSKKNKKNELATLLETTREASNNDKLRIIFEELPETEEELFMIAKLLGAKKKNIFVRQNANEENLNSLDLTSVNILAFATHADVSGTISNIKEGFLLLSPTENSDGFLTASEISKLKINAEWVILSACDTALGDEPNSKEMFSSLVKSFFYAGSNSLLVSHWPVASIATSILTTNTFKHLKQNKELTKSEALNYAMLDLIKSKDFDFSHPYYWSPFILVGKTENQSFKF